MGLSCSRLEFLTAVAADRLGLLLWVQTKDGQRGRNRPKSLAELLMSAPMSDGDSSSGREVEAFDTPEAFELARNELIDSMRR